MPIPALLQFNRENKKKYKTPNSLDERKVTRVTARQELHFFLTISWPLTTASLFVFYT
jgi:hypothetical protein